MGGREGKGVSLAVAGRPLRKAERCTGGQCHGQRSTEDGGVSWPRLEIFAFIVSSEKTLRRSPTWSDLWVEKCHSAAK